MILHLWREFMMLWRPDPIISRLIDIEIELAKEDHTLVDDFPIETD